jgi:hypothetical protein
MEKMDIAFDDGASGDIFVHEFTETTSNYGNVFLKELLQLLLLRLAFSLSNQNANQNQNGNEALRTALARLTS